MQKANADRSRQRAKRTAFTGRFERESVEQILPPNKTQPEIDYRVQAVIELMASDLREKYSVSELAQKVYLSPFRLWHLFKAETGLTPMLYLRHLRLKRAAESLRSSFMPVNQILEEVGMTESRFFPAFKQLFGLTPVEFRQHHLALKSKKICSDSRIRQ